MLKPVKGKADGGHGDSSASGTSKPKPFDDMTVKELKEMLGKNGQPTNGNKATLIGRAKALQQQ